MSDKVNSPKHYTADPSGVECITITRHRTFNIGNAIKYCWRGGLKVAEGATSAAILEDYNKSLWYLCDEIQRLGGKVTCRHPAMVAGVISDMATAIPKPDAQVAPVVPLSDPKDGVPRWVRLQDTVDDEDVACRSCRCLWWACQSANAKSARCAKCGVEIVNLRGGGYKSVAINSEKPEL
jgi:hypothetical protein